MPSNKNPLHAMHEQAEATFLPYADDLPIVESYGEPEAEYAAIRKAAALMDAPHRAVIIVTGKDRLAFLHNKVTNDTNRLTAGQGCYAYLLNVKGRIVMDMNILQAEEATLIETDQRCAPVFLQTMERYLFSEDVRILDGTGQVGRLTLLGPNTVALLKKVLDAGVETLSEPLRHAKRTIGRSQVTVFRNDQAGETQYELILPRDQMMELWQTLHEAGNGHGEEHESGINLRANGWSAFNTARIEAGTPLYNIDITDNHLPMETGHWYTRAVSTTKGCYLGQEIVARMHAHNTVSRLLVGLRIEGERLPLAGTAIYEQAPAGGVASAQQVGMITSSCHSPMLGNVPIAMAYVKKAFAAPDKKLEVLAEGSRATATVTELPFWKK